MNEEQLKAENEQLKTLLAWAYVKLRFYSFNKMEDCLKLDEIKLVLMDLQ